MDNLTIYNRVRSVPENAQKTIFGGRLKGMTDVNPMWRIQVLTETFGPCGIGWKYEITDKRLEPASDGTVAAFLDINLYIRQGGEWSEPIPGTGGSMFVASEKSGLYVSDECFKMALTDAISVSCKALGMAADVYWSKGRTKYDMHEQPEIPSGMQKSVRPAPSILCAECGKEIRGIRSKDGAEYIPAEVAKRMNGLCYQCGTKHGFTI